MGNFTETFGQHGFFKRNVLKIVHLTYFFGTSGKKVSLQNRLESSVASKQSGRKCLQKNLHELQNKPAFIVFCGNFSKFCNITFNFGSLSLESTSPRACTAWCTK